MTNEVLELWLSASSLYPPKINTWAMFKGAHPLQRKRANYPLMFSITGSTYVHKFAVML